MLSKNTLFSILFMFSNILFAQSITMKIRWVDDKTSAPDIINSVNETLENKILPSFSKYLASQNNFYSDKLKYDEIEISYMVSELRFEGILIIDKTDSLLFREVSFYETSYQDAKGIYLCELVKSHLATYVWSYPTFITAKESRDRYYVKYQLPNNKEIIFGYYDYNSGDYMPKLSLSSVQYLRIVESIQKVKKKNVVTKERKFIDADYTKGAKEFYKYDGEFTKYFLPETHLINMGPK